METNKKAICLRKEILKDNIDDIPITVFGELFDKLKEPSTLVLTDFTVPKYMMTRLLKSTLMSTTHKPERELF